LLALLYARRYPERVRSLTLLSVGVHPSIDWQAHYYVQLLLLRCSREMALTQTVYNIFGPQSRSMTRKFREILEQDLISSLSPHSLYQRVNISPAQVSVPLLVCASRDDVIIDLNLLSGWQPYLKGGDQSEAPALRDRLWQCSSGGYFFHHFYPQQVNEQILDFWTSFGLWTHLPSKSNTHFPNFFNTPSIND
jgi:pimeloyl-ACP methyl ester carboxylesterase